MAKGYLRVDDKERIHVRGDAPLPQRIRTKPEGEEKEKEEVNFFCTENMPPSLIERFQSLEEKSRSEYRRLYLAMPAGYNAFLKQLDAQNRSSHTWRYLQAAEYKERLEADAMAAEMRLADLQIFYFFEFFVTFHAAVAVGGCA